MAWDDLHPNKQRVVSYSGVPTLPSGSGLTWLQLQASAQEQAAREAAAAAALANAQANAAKRDGKNRSNKENKNTQQIIDTLLGSLRGYETGRDQALVNADKIFAEGLKGLDSQYGQTVTDLQGSQDMNESDETSKTYANRANRAREQQSILEQMVSQGAGETDRLRGMVQAFENADANQLEVTGNYYDQLNGVNSELRQSNSSIENARRNLYGQQQDAATQAHENYYANYSQIWTEAQRAGASNTNIASDYSNAFNANYGGLDPVAEAAKFAGKTYDWQAPAPGWAEAWSGKKTQMGVQDTTPTKFAASTRLGGLKRAEGANLRKEELP